MKGKRVLSVGPIEFLNLIKNASLVLTSSFHCTVFSIMFHIPFVCLNVENEERLSSLLIQTELTSRLVNNTNIYEKMENLLGEIDFGKAKNHFSEKQKEGINYLKRVLEIYDL